MLGTAQGNVARKGLAPRITLRHGDATNFDTQAAFGVRTFDRVFIYYALSMIPDWRMALWQAVAKVAPGGELHIVDFGSQAKLPSWFKAALRAWLQRFSVHPRDELAGEIGYHATRVRLGPKRGKKVAGIDLGRIEKPVARPVVDQ